MNLKKLLAVLAALMLLGLPAWAQEAGEAIEIIDINGSRYPEGGQTQMVVEFSNFATEPDPAAVEVTANGQPVTDLVVEPVGASPVPVGVVLVIDTSGSMEGAPMASAIAAAQSFVDQARAEDRIAIVTFADAVQVLSGFTNNKQALNAALAGLVAAGETVAQTLARETWEEAGLRLDALQAVAPLGRLTIRRPVREGYMVEHIEMFEALVPAGQRPENQDGEVQAFACLERAALLDQLAADAFTLEAGLILAHALRPL